MFEHRPRDLQVAFLESQVGSMKRMVGHRFSRKRFAATDQPLGGVTPITQRVRSFRFRTHCRPQPIRRHLSLAHAMLRQGVEQPIAARPSHRDLRRPKRWNRRPTTSRCRFYCAPPRSPVYPCSVRQACAGCILHASSHHLSVSYKHSSMLSALPVVTLTETPS